MSSLFVTLHNSAASMRVFERGITVVQSNVANVNTPGYARQDQVLVATASDLSSGVTGTVASGGTRDSRNEFAEQSVRRSLHAMGYSGEYSAHLSRLEAVFDIAEGSGVGAALQELFNAFSALSVAPNDTSARQTVVQSAKQLAAAFQQAAAVLNSAKSEAGTAMVNEASGINATIKEIQAVNHQFKQNAKAHEDAGLNAQLTTLLESLAESVDFGVLRSEDGSVNIFAGGQVPLLIGEHIYPLTADLSGSSAKILDYEGHDVLSKITSGKIAAQAKLYNEAIPAYAAGFDRMASTLADAVNAQLAQGLDQSGNAPTANLFSYDAGLGAARTLAVNSLKPSDLAAASVGAPGGNGNARALAELANRDLIDGGTITEFYGALAAQAGRDLSAASDAAGLQSSLSTQARQLRDDISHVNLDEEAIRLLEFQRAYEAAAKMVSTLDEMTRTVLNMI